MGVRKNRSDRELYLRYWVGCQRAPKGMRWTKPKVMLVALERLVVTESALGVQDLYDFVKKSMAERGNKGNVYLEYAWSCFNKGGRSKRILGEADLLAAVQGGEVNRWYNKLTPRRQGDTKSATVMQAGNPQRLRQQIAAVNAKVSESTPNPSKVLGDAIRAEALAAQQRRAEFAAQFRAEQALVERFKAMSKGA